MNNLVLLTIPILFQHCLFAGIFSNAYYAPFKSQPCLAEFYELTKREPEAVPPVLRSLKSWADFYKLSEDPQNTPPETVYLTSWKISERQKRMIATRLADTDHFHKELSAQKDGSTDNYMFAHVIRGSEDIRQFLARQEELIEAFHELILSTKQERRRTYLGFSSIVGIGMVSGALIGLSDQDLQLGSGMILLSGSSILLNPLVASFLEKDRTRAEFLADVDELLAGRTDRRWIFSSNTLELEREAYEYLRAGRLAEAKGGLSQQYIADVVGGRGHSMEGNQYFHVEKPGTVFVSVDRVFRGGGEGFDPTLTLLYRVSAKPPDPPPYGKIKRKKLSRQAEVRQVWEGVFGQLSPVPIPVRR